MRERLGKVAEHLTGLGVDLLAEQAKIVGVSQKRFEHLLGLFDLAQGDQVVNEPEGADGKASLAAFQAIIETLVAVYESLWGQQVAPDRLDGRSHHRVARFDE